MRATDNVTNLERRAFSLREVAKMYGVCSSFCAWRSPAAVEDLFDWGGAC